jgi:hypothetical protein
MADPHKALPVQLTGHAVSDDGRHGVLIFRHPIGKPVALAIPIEQVSTLAMAAADITADAQRKLGADLPAPAVLRVKRWSITSKHNARIFTFATDHFEICLEVTPEAVKEDAAAS